MIKAEIVAHSLNPQGDELISVLATFPRIILAEVNTHRMLSKNTSSSRAIPFNKMVEAVKNNPFIPIAWQKEHKGMQGTEYFTQQEDIDYAIGTWLHAIDAAIQEAKIMNSSALGVTKQLCNRLLEPFMWTTMLITGSREGWDNFFNLRNPSYSFGEKTNSPKIWKSKKDAIKNFPDWSTRNDLFWNTINKGQSEIHMMALAECIYDAVNESTPKELKAGEWHIPFQEKFTYESNGAWDNFCNKVRPESQETDLWEDVEDLAIKVSVAMAARTSYTVVGEQKEIDYEVMIGLHDRLLTQDPPHSSPFEHTARAMNDSEYNTFVKGQVEWYTEKYISIPLKESKGWCYNLKGFIPYRYMVDNNIEL